MARSDLEIVRPRSASFRAGASVACDGYFCLGCLACLTACPAAADCAAAPLPADQPPLTVTYHESCHLSHGQKVVQQPRQWLRAIPNLRLVVLTEANWCCGSAGIYKLIQPVMADALWARKPTAGTSRRPPYHQTA